MSFLSSRLNRLQRTARAIGGISLALTLLGLVFQPQIAFVSYLWAWLFWFSLGLGCLNVAMIHHLTSGGWGNITRRFFEAGYMTLPVLALLFVPIFFGLRELYPWANPAAVAADKILSQKAVYENVPWFTLRAVFFFAVWIQIAFCLRRWSLQQDAIPDARPTIKARILSGPSVAIVPLTATFAYVDWVMSIENAWFSTIFALILMAGGVLITLAFGIILLKWFHTEIPFAGTVSTKHVLDLGNLLLAFVMFWTYVAFSQLLIMYSGNQPHEIEWYLHRIAGSWKWLLTFIALFHFLVPFLVLLFRSYKQNLSALASVALLIFLVHAVQTFWVIAPTFYSSGISIHWSDFAAWIGIGGIWAATFAGILKRHPLLIRNVAQGESEAAAIRHEK